MFDCPVRTDDVTRRPGEVLIAYGEAEDGRIRHVSEVPSGLACGCICPGCGGRLVAHKGGKRTHHFVHHAPTNCTGGRESALHRLAKQLIAERGLIVVPAVVARHGDEERPLRVAMEFRPDSVAIEKGMDGMRPDIIACKGCRELLVEVAVTHFCGPEKIRLIRERQLAAIEIDLRQVPPAAPREVLENAILRSAPRRWLFNRHEARVADEMRAEAEFREAHAKVAEERRRRRRAKMVGARADRLVEAWRGAPGRSDVRPSVVDQISRVQEVGLGGLLFPTLEGAPCFAVGNTVWQAAVVGRFCLDWSRTCFPPFSTEDVIRFLRTAGAIRPEFADPLGREIVAAARERELGFRPPFETILAFLGKLEKLGILSRVSGHWGPGGAKLREATDRDVAIELGRARAVKVRAKLEALLSGLAKGHGVDADRWMRTNHPGLNSTPESIAMASEWNGRNLIDRLGRLAAMLEPGAPVEEDLLGLPLEGEREARREEWRVAEEARRQREEERARAAAEMARLAALGRLNAVATLACAILGPEDAQAWLAAPQRFLDGRALRDIEGLSEGEEERARVALHREHERLIAADRAREIAARCRERLLEEAERVLGNRARAELWMRQMNRMLGNRRPEDVCIDETSRAMCAATLRPGRRAVRR